MTPTHISTIDFDNYEMKCPYYVSNQGARCPFPRCEHPRQTGIYCTCLEHCPLSNRDWDSLVMHKSVEFRPYVELV